MTYRDFWKVISTQLFNGRVFISTCIPAWKVTRTIMAIQKHTHLTRGHWSLYTEILSCQQKYKRYGMF